MKSISILFFLFLVPILSNRLPAQGFCGTSGTYPDLLSGVNRTALASLSEYKVRVVLHFVRNSNGSGGVNPAKATDIMNLLHTYFQPHGICFHLDHINFIDNDDFSTNWNDHCPLGAATGPYDDDDYDQLFNTDRTANAIDIYILPESVNGFIYNLSAGIPATALAVKFFESGSTINNMALPHEMGHCLGLFHTFHGTGGEYNGTFCNGITCYSLPELVNGSNCNYAGDYVCDTPADPISSTSESTPDCQWPNPFGLKDAMGNLYNPDPRNMMAYLGGFACKTYFSSGQGQRMRDHLAFSPTLQQVIIPGGCTQMLTQEKSGATPYFPMLKESHEWFVFVNFLIANSTDALRFVKGECPSGPCYQLQRKSLYIPVIWRNDTGDDGRNDTIFSPSGAFWYVEDSVQQKVWFTIDSRRPLLYDYSLKPGDLHPRDTNFVLDSISYIVLMDGSRRRQFNFQHKMYDNGKIIWIEGIGNIYDPVTPERWDLFPVRLAGVLCHSDAGIALYYKGYPSAPEPPIPCVNYIPPFSVVTGVNDRQGNLPKTLSLYPNPATETIFVAPIETGGRTEVSIHDLHGRVLHRYLFDRLDDGAELPVAHLHPGVYICIVRAAGQTWTGRWVKL